MLINRTFFEAEIKIANANTTGAGVGEVVDILIQQYENEILTDILGYPLYQAFKSGLAADPIPQIWKDLRDGKTFTNTSNKVVRWKGLINQPELNGQKYSLIAYFVYYRYMANNATQTTSGGEKKSKSENTVDASPANKMINAWNKMSTWILELFYYLEQHKADYPDWNCSNVIGCYISKYSKNNTFGI